jgi:hypothetical protein
MKEVDLFPVVKAWLGHHGFQVIAEVPRVYADYSTIDVVGWRPGRAVAVELKRGFTKNLAYQAARGTLCTPWTYAAAPTRVPAGFLENARKAGFGVLRVTDAVEVVTKPRICTRNPLVWIYTRKFERHCAEMVRFGIGADRVGGVPTLTGVGPAQEVSRAVAAYREEHPGATWKELYEKIPHHYANVASMRGALRSRGLA